MRQNGRQFHESVARRKLKWQDFYYNSRISSDMQYCNKSLFYTPKTGYKMPSLQGFHFYNNINIFTLNNLLKLSVLLHGLKLLSDCKNKLAAVKDFYIL